MIAAWRSGLRGLSPTISLFREPQQAVWKNLRPYSTVRTIYKYEVPIKDEMTLLLPEGAEIIDLLVQNNKPHLFAIVDSKAPMKPHSFSMRGTGFPLNGKEGAHIRSFVLEGGAFVGHLFKRTEKTE